MPGGPGGEGTDQEGCGPQQVEHLQCVTYPSIEELKKGQKTDSPQQLVRSLRRNKKPDGYRFQRYHDRFPSAIGGVVEVDTRGWAFAMGLGLGLSV